MLYTKEGSAFSPQDFTQTTHLVTFPAYIDSIDVSITIIDDLEIEPKENFSVMIGSSEADPDVIIGLPMMMNVTIWDDDYFGKTEQGNYSTITCFLFF